MRPGRLPLPLITLIASIDNRGPSPSLVPYDDLPRQLPEPFTFPAARIRETSATVGGQLATTLRPMRTGTTRSGTDRARERNARRARRKNRKR